MVMGRRRYLEGRHALGLRVPGGRPPRILDWLRRAVVTEAEKELAEAQSGNDEDGRAVDR